MQYLQTFIKPWRERTKHMSYTIKRVSLLVVGGTALFAVAASSQGLGLGGLLALLIAFGCQIGLFILTQSKPSEALPAPAPPPVVNTLISPTVVVNEVRTAALVSYGQIGTVKIRKERQRQKGELRSMMLDPFIGEELMMEVGVRVIAGVNLKHLRDEDVFIAADGKSAEITLPPTKVFMVYVDESLTHVLWHKKGWLSSHDINMMDAARREAMESMVNAAIEKGLLEKAGDQAAQTVASIARGLGLEHVTVRPTMPAIGQHYEELHDPELRERAIELPLHKPDNPPLVSSE